MTNNEIPQKKIWNQKEEIPEDIPTAKEMMALIPSKVPTNSVLTSVVIIDDYIMAKNEEIRTLQTVRAELMNRATSENIEEDAKAYIVKILGEKNRNPIIGELLVKFKELHKATYDKIRALQVTKLNDSLTKKMHELPDAEIPLGLVDKEVGKTAATEFTGYQPQTVTLKVVKKHGV